MLPVDEAVGGLEGDQLTGAGLGGAGRQEELGSWLALGWVVGPWLALGWVVRLALALGWVVGGLAGLIGQPVQGLGVLLGRKDPLHTGELGAVGGVELLACGLGRGGRGGRGVWLELGDRGVEQVAGGRGRGQAHWGGVVGRGGGLGWGGVGGPRGGGGWRPYGITRLGCGLCREGGRVWGQTATAAAARRPLSQPHFLLG